MAKFVVTGVLIEEPRKTRLNSGKELVNILVEEKGDGSKKEYVNVFSIDFMGKIGDKIPLNVKLAGTPVVVYGNISGREFNGKYYTSLLGGDITFITQGTFNKRVAPTQAELDDAKDPDIESDDLANGDLPF